MKRCVAVIFSGAAILLAIFLWPGLRIGDHQPAGERPSAVAQEPPLRTGQAGASVSSAVPRAPALTAPSPAAHPSVPLARLGGSLAVPPPPVTAFSNWTAAFFAGDPAVDLARGEALAWQRRDAMRALIESNPEQALALTVPFRWRRELPDRITRHFEQQVDGRGALNVAIATDFQRAGSTVLREVIIGETRYKGFVYGRRSIQVSQPDLPLHGIAVADRLALHSDPIRLVELGEVAALEIARGQSLPGACSVCGQPGRAGEALLAGDIGGEWAAFCCRDHVRLVKDAWIAAEGAKAISAAGERWTHGTKTLLYIRLNFPDDLTEPISEGQAYAVMDEVNSFYTEGSYNRTALDPTVTPLLTLPRTKSWYSTSGPGALLDDARELARRAGYDTRNYDLDIVAFTSVPEYDFGGLGYVHGKGTWLQSMGAGVTAHELGHNYGLLHANYWNTTNYSRIGPGTNVEYGNIFDTMGAAAAGNNQFGAAFKNILDWLPDSAIATVVTNGLCRLYPFDVPLRVDGRLYAARVSKDSTRDYWLEFRNLFTGNPSLQNGLLLNWGPCAQSGGGTALLDTTPGSPSGSDSRQDAAVVIGRTFSDSLAGVHFTPVARGVTGTNVWIDVQFYLGFFAGNRPPAVFIEADPTNAAPGELVHFHAVASDPDGDPLAFAWTFDDLSFSTNNAPWTYKSWTAPGEKVVRCVVSDMKGGSASANLLVTVGQPAGFRISGTVRDLAGAPLEGVRIDNPGRPVYTDSQGRYLIVQMTGQVDLQAFQYGYLVTNAGWDNPLSVTSSLPQVNFIGVPLPSLRLTVLTNLIPENDTAPKQVVLTRTGDTNADLTVVLNLSGSAAPAGDYTLNPQLQAGPNSVVIPAGEYSVAIDVRALNDSLVEGPETIVLTLAEDEDYQLVPAAEVILSILDDEPVTRPVVSVSVPAPSTPENGQDHGVFLLQRTGGTLADLPVFYTVSGSATAGVDYSTLAGVAVIPAGSSSVALALVPLDDKRVEPPESVVLSLSPNANYSISGSPGTIQIVDDDQLTVSVFPSGSPAVEPGSPGRFTVKRDGDLTAGLLVNLLIGGSATPGLDYQPLANALLIPPGAASADFFLVPIDDSLVEGDEFVTLTLTNGPGYDVGTPGSARLLIRDNEKVPVNLTAGDASASEPGSDTASFTISRGSVTGGNLTVYLAISGSALNGIDYVPVDSAIVIPDGASSVTIEIIPFDDLHVEPMEEILVAIAESTNYLANPGARVRLTLADDDPSSVPAVGFCLAASSAPESDSPGICVSLSETSAVPISVDFKVIGGTASGSDYLLPEPTLIFQPGERGRTLPLTILNNSTTQPNRTVRLVLFNPIGATLDGVKIHTYTILDDDPNVVTIAATAPSALETGNSPGNFRISRTGSATSNLVVFFQVTGTASAPTDFAALGNSVALPAGSTFVDLPVIPVDDSTVELSQTVVVTLTSAPGATLGSPNTATVTISDNDPDSLPVIAVTATNQPFAVEGGASGAFVFWRATTNGSLTISLELLGTAQNMIDYQPIPATVTIPAGQFSASLNVVPIEDNLVEGEETVVAAVVSRDTYRVAFPSSATVTLQDNDQRVRVDASDFVAAEPGANKGEVVFTRFGTTNTDLQVFFAIAGTAVLGLDYAAFSNSIIIPAGQLSAALPVLPLDDALVEGAETVRISLAANPLYELGEATSSVVTIYDDEPMFYISATVSNVVEGSRDPGVFTLFREGDPKYDVTARLAVGGTALSGVDYPPFQTNVYFACGVISIDLLVFPTNELAMEGIESVNVTILPDPAYTILSPGSAMLTIEDAASNLAPAIAITSPTAPAVFLLGTNVGIILETTVADDDTNSPLTLLWTQVGGPPALGFGATNTPNNTAIFTNEGVYVLRLTADDGVLTNYAELTAVVNAVDLLSTNLLHWTLDEGSGINVLDSSGAGRHGVITGIPQWSSNGVLGGALRLSGTNNSISSLEGGFLDGLSQFSLSLWLYLDSTNVDRGLFTAGDGGTNATLTLSTRNYSSCGNSTNVIEATIATTEGVVRRISASDRLTNGWQHLVLTWSNGLAPALFINGRLDQPLSGMQPLAGVLTNCPRFIVGRGLDGSTSSCEGWIDDVRLFPRALDAGDIVALASLPPANYGAIVHAGPDLTVQLITPATLEGNITDDGQPDPPARTTNTWLLAQGPAPVTLTNANALTNTLFFPQAGEFVFRLIGDDGQVKVFDDATVTVIEPTQVDVYAFDPEAAELGPDTGFFTFTRTGDTNFDLTVILAISGIASNGMDFPALPVTLTFSNGVRTVDLLLSPFLDHRTEGDETFTFTIVSNLAYSIGSGEATITIHDSPYGAWTVNHFTLEELTDPTLSGEAADFDHDRLVNFADYAVNRDPKYPETNAPLVTALELDPADNLYHLTLTYTRRLLPTDTGYQVRLSHDLLTWNTGTNYVEEIQVTDDGNALTETVKARVKAPWTNGVSQFIDVQVWLLSTGP